jgi:uncharacterized protein
MPDRESRDLTKFERLVLINQYRILEAVDPENAEDHASIREAIEWGYQSAIDSLFEHVFDGLSREECGLVDNALAVHDALQRSYDALDDKAGIDRSRLEFPGFDGNNETSHMAYAQYVVEREMPIPRFTHVRRSGGTFNSHTPMRSEYQRMIRVWESVGRGYQLTPDQIKQILDR